MPALIRKVKRRNMNKPHLIFYIHAEFTLLRNSIYTSTIFPFISILELLHQSNNILAMLKYTCQCITNVLACKYQ